MVFPAEIKKQQHFSHWPIVAAYGSTLWHSAQCIAKLSTIVHVHRVRVYARLQRLSSAFQRNDVFRNAYATDPPLHGTSARQLLSHDGFHDVQPLALHGYRHRSRHRVFLFRFSSPVVDRNGRPLSIATTVNSDGGRTNSRITDKVPRNWLAMYSLLLGYITTECHSAHAV